MQCRKNFHLKILIPVNRQNIAYDNFFNLIKKEFTNKFGGCTLTTVTGEFKSRTGRTIKDKNRSVEVDIPANLNEIELFATELKNRAYKALNEEAIYLSYHKVNS